MDDESTIGNRWRRSFSRGIGRLRRVNHDVNKSTFGRVFRLDGCGHVRFSRPEARDYREAERIRFREADSSSILMVQPKQIEDANFTTEIRAGLTTFATMAYIIAVNVSPWSLPIAISTSLSRSHHHRLPSSVPPEGPASA